MSISPDTSCGNVSDCSFTNTSQETSVSQDGLQLKPSNFKNERTYLSNRKKYSEKYTSRPAFEKHKNIEWPELPQNDVGKKVNNNTKVSLVNNHGNSVNIGKAKDKKLKGKRNSGFALLESRPVGMSDSQVCVNGLNLCFPQKNNCPKHLNNQVLHHSRNRVDIKSVLEPKRGRMTKNYEIMQKIVNERRKLSDENLVGKDVKVISKKKWCNSNQAVCSLDTVPLTLSNEVEHSRNDENFRANIKYHLSRINNKLTENRQTVMNQYRERLDEISEHMELLCHNASSKTSIPRRKDEVLAYLQSFRDQFNQMKEESNNFENSTGLKIPLELSNK